MSRASISALLAAMLVLASCSGTDQFTLTLRARDDMEFAEGNCSLTVNDRGPGAPGEDETVTCRGYSLAREWRGAAGRRATTPAHSLTVEHSTPEFGKAECGGRMLVNVVWMVTRPGPSQHDDTFELHIDDGSILVLDPEQGMFAVGFADACARVSGVWRGVAGRLRGHDGSFILGNDSVQTTLQLVEE
jgi:hypothetical protein